MWPFTRKPAPLCGVDDHDFYGNADFLYLTCQKCGRTPEDVEHQARMLDAKQRGFWHPVMENRQQPYYVMDINQTTKRVIPRIP